MSLTNSRKTAFFSAQTPTVDNDFTAHNNLVFNSLSTTSATVQSSTISDSFDFNTFYFFGIQESRGDVMYIML